jgi:hypothetical protein
VAAWNCVKLGVIKNSFSIPPAYDLHGMHPGETEVLTKLYRTKVKPIR